jgi:hypothetical protein
MVGTVKEAMIKEKNTAMRIYDVKVEVGLGMVIIRVECSMIRIVIHVIHTAGV